MHKSWGAVGDVQHPAGLKVNRRREGEANKKPATHVPHTTYGTCPFLSCPVALSVVVLDVTPTATAEAVDTGCLLVRFVRCCCFRAAG